MPERADYQQVVLHARLLAALQKINPHISITALEEVAVSKPGYPVLFKKQPQKKGLAF